MTDLTVCICTYNRADLLDRALESLAEARPPAAGDWELLLVDNNSADHTPEIATKYASRLPLRYVKETEQGLSHSRNRACRESRGDLLAFMDDDVRVSAGWMTEFLAATQRFPEAEFFGGRVLPDWAGGRPAWLVDEDLPHIAGLIVKFDLGEEARWLEAADPLPFGASFGLRRGLIERMEPFRAELGVVGQTPGRGEEAEYMERARALGSRGAYAATAVSFHFVDPLRFRLGYLYRFGVEKGIAAARMADEGEVRGGSSMRAVLFLLRGGLQLFKGRGDRFRQCVINAGIEAGLRREAG